MPFPVAHAAAVDWNPLLRFEPPPLAVNGGKFYGKQKSLEELNYGRFQPVTTDFRTVFAESLSKLFHFDPFKAELFPGYKGNGKDYLNFAKQLKEV